MGAGLWSFLPLGWRVHMRIEQIIREEIDAIGGQEMRCPTLTPAELWETTGRIAVPIIFKLKDSGGRPFVLSWTHEESMTFLGQELQSYKQLPQVWYHFSTKDRDEPRPRGGLLRVREFIMKDSYSFDVDEAGLDASFKKHEEAYARIFERCGLEAYLTEAESGTMGGKESLGFLAPTGLRRERVDALRERRLLRRRRGCAREGASGRASGRSRRAGAGGDARDHDDRGGRGVPRHLGDGDREGASRGDRRPARARARPWRRPSQSREARDDLPGCVPACNG